MNLEPPVLSSYNSLRRKLKRRFYIPRLYMQVWLPSLVPVICAVAWMLRDDGWVWLAYLTGFLWLLGNIGSLLLFGISFFTLRNRKDIQKPGPRFFGIYFLSKLLTLFALLSGRIDVAIILAYGYDALAAFTTKHFTRANAMSALGHTLLLLAFVTDVVWLYLLMLTFSWWWKYRMPSLIEIVRSRPTREKYVQETRESCAAGGG
jgi:hypothetical protein